MRAQRKTKSGGPRTWLIVTSMPFMIAAATGVCRAAPEHVLSPHVTVVQGAVNGVCIRQNGRRLVVYGDPEQNWRTADTVLFTHGRRDVVWAGRSLVANGAKSVVPAKEAEQFAKTDEFWAVFWDKRFHDYAQQSTRRPIEPLRVDRTVQEGDRIEWQDARIAVLDTPGYTRGAVSYFIEIDGLKYGFVGDVIYGHGRLLDLYSLQDAVSEAQIGGYHGYAGRIGDLLQSLRKIAEQKPDILVPARGPAITQPRAAIDRLIERLQAVYENYLSINAGHWYFKDRYDILAARALGSAGKVTWMPYAKTIEKSPPDWIVPIGNTRLILSQDGSGFLIDCGSQGIISDIRKLQHQGRLTTIEGLFITHYHDDHTDKISEFLEPSDCPVYVTPLMEDVTRHPGAYRLPAMTANAIARLNVVPDGHKQRWKEFTLTFYDFPGQTIYHSALLVERDDGQAIFFVGDSFTPSGIDDYCLQNRNLLHDGKGYFYCLDVLKDGIPSRALLINQHVLEPFRFDGSQIDHMTTVLAQRRKILGDLFPWDEPNYGIDEQWVRFYPYGQEARPGASAQLSVTVLNHSHTPTTFSVRLNAPDGWTIEPERAWVTPDPGQEGHARFRVRLPDDPSRSVYAITADVAFGPWDLRHWCECLVKMAP